MTKHWPIFTWLSLWLIAAIIVLLNSNGIGDNGDGLQHYQFAKYAHLHPENFLDPWAKTGFTLIAWPFAQLGLNGMKLMNILSTVICLVLVYKIGGFLQIGKSWSSVIILSLSTFYFKLMFSGLTEHLFSLVLILVIYLLLKNKWVLATLILSTLPFFRQEGYIIMVSLVPFYLWRRKWKMFFLFPVTFLFIGLIGGIYYEDAGWIIQSNPYGFHQTYGKGSLFTFFTHLYYNLGLVNLIFFVVGLISLFTLLLKSPSKQTKEIFWLIFLPFLAFFTAHTVFWTFGIFHSMGLQRVLNCVTPLVAIIGALGFSTLLKPLPKKLNKATVVLLTVILIGFPLIPSPANINFSKDFSRTEFENKMQLACFNAQGTSFNPYIYYEHPLVPFFLQLDPFDKTTCDQLLDLGTVDPKPGSVIIWENLLTQLQSGKLEAEILSDPRLTQVFETKTDNGKQRIIVFEVK